MSLSLCLCLCACVQELDSMPSFVLPSEQIPFKSSSISDLRLLLLLNSSEYETSSYSKDNKGPMNNERDKISIAAEAAVRCAHTLTLTHTHTDERRHWKRMHATERQSATTFEAVSENVLPCAAHLAAARSQLRAR